MGIAKTKTTPKKHYVPNTDIELHHVLTFVGGRRKFVWRRMDLHNYMDHPNVEVR